MKFKLFGHFFKLFAGVIVVAGIAILGAYFGCANGAEQTSLQEEARQEIRRMIIGTGKHQWRGIIIRLQESGKLVSEDLEKIDFSLPGDSSYGDNPEIEFFNPAGRFKAQPIPQELIERATGQKNTRLIFNLRRSNYRSEAPQSELGVQGIADRLYAVLPNVSKTCLEPDVPQESLFLKLAEDNRMVVEDKASLFECAYKENSTQVYMFLSFAMRLQLEGDKKWSLY